MFITVEKLKKANACKKGFLFFRRKYPNGISFADLVEKEGDNITDEFLHWGYDTLNPDAADILLYEKLLNIENCQYYYHSKDIHNCQQISKSKHVNNSAEVRDSENVNNSLQVTGGRYVDDSSFIAESRFITQSKNIYLSDNIEASVEVARSNSVVNSQGIFQCGNVVDCRDLRMCQNLDSSYFCADCKDGEKLLFCQDLSNAKCYIFNHAISERQYERIVQQYNRFCGDGIKFLYNWDTVDGVPEVNFNYGKHYLGFSEIFWTWVASLPYYDPSILYSICFKKELLGKE